MDFYNIEDIKRLRGLVSVVPSEREYLHRVVRKYKPQYVIETGSGASSLSFLAVLREVRSGTLYSIDLPDREGRGQIKELLTGIKEHYPEWQFYEENILVRLPQLVMELPQFDLFFHDSNHTSSHVLFEFATACLKLKRGGLFGMHDIRMNGLQEFIEYINWNKKFKFIGRRRQVAFWRKR